MQTLRAPDFYLASTEHRGDLARVRAGWWGERMVGPYESEFVAARLDPPVIGQGFGLGGKDITDVLLSPHYRGDSLFLIGTYPVAVYIYRALNSTPLSDLRTFGATDIEMIAWGEVYENEKTARAAASATRDNRY